MPDLVMHHYFGRELLKKLPSEVVTKIDDLKLYDFATAGPDPFFFISFWKKEINSQGLAFGNLMHRVKTEAFFRELIEITKKYPIMFSYFCGFMAHFALDNKAHPYVFHKTGVYEVDKPETLKYRGLHTKLERAMDTYIIKKAYYPNSHKFKIYKKVLRLRKLDKKYKKPFNELYNVYNLPNGFEYVSKSVIDQRKFYHFIYDPWGLMQKILTKLDNGKSSLDLKVLSYYKKEITTIDIFNEKHTKWVNPSDDTIVSNASFWDLFNEALDLASTIITKAYKEIFEDKLDTKYLPNLNYLDGLNCDVNKKMQFFNNIFEEDKNV